MRQPKKSRVGSGEERLSREFFSHLQSSCGFLLPKTTQQNFEHLWAKLSATPRLPILQRLTVEGGSRQDWFNIFRDAAIGHVHEGLAASYYHARNIALLEDNIINLVLERSDDLVFQEGSVVASGNTRKLDFEYQAFTFAIRRTLEYFATAIGAAFKCEAHRIRSLAKSIRGADPRDVSNRVCQRLQEVLPTLKDILPATTEKRSARDLIAHWRPVQAGTLNMRQRDGRIELSFAGGGENLRAWHSDVTIQLVKRQKSVVALISLSPVLENQIRRVESLIFAIYSDLGLTTR